jgi:hypothetical protein
MTNYVMNGRMYFASGVPYPWSHTENQIHIGWAATDGDKIRLSVVPRVPAYRLKTDDVFNDNHNLETHLTPAVRELLKAYLCEIVANHKRERGKESDVAYWLNMAAAKRQDAERLLSKAETNVRKERTGGNPGRITRTFP